MRTAVAAGLAALLLAGCTAAADDASRTAAGSATVPATSPKVAPRPAPVTDVYAHTRAGMTSPKVRGELALVYVPNLGDGTVSVIDQRTLRVVRTLRVGSQPQHVVPSWDLQTLWVNNNASDSLSPIDPRTGRLAGPAKPVADPYNLYFTPDGSTAMVMAERERRIDFYDPHTFRLRQQLHLGPQCRGVNHVDFAPDGRWFIATCEFSGQLVKVDVPHRRVLGYLDLNRPGHPSAPQDVKVEPRGVLWYVADMNAAGLHEIDGARLREVGFLPTGPETHGLYPSRDGRYLYVANRGGMLMQAGAPYAHAGDHGSVSVVSFASRKVAATWSIPGGGTPDMGNVSADGSRLWLSGRRSGVVYVFATGGGAPSRGHLLRKIRVGREPHGLAVWPLPGRYSLGHTGILR